MKDLIKGLFAVCLLLIMISSGCSDDHSLSGKEVCTGNPETATEKDTIICGTYTSNKNDVGYTVTSRLIGAFRGDGRYLGHHIISERDKVLRVLEYRFYDNGEEGDPVATVQLPTAVIEARDVEVDREDSIVVNVDIINMKTTEDAQNPVGRKKKRAVLVRDEARRRDTESM